MFKSFFLGGFECATGYNREGTWIDLIADTAHHLHADDDYRRIRDVGIRAVRDAIRWPLVDHGGGRFDFSSVAPVVAAARKNDIDVVWDLFHYGYPSGVDLLSDSFIDRFAAYCAACARFLRRRSDQPLWFTPVNEPSYFAWAAGEAGHFAPYLTDNCRALKMALVRAALRGIDAIRAEVPDARFLHADPICRVVPPSDDPAAIAAAHHFNREIVFEAWDMLCGRRHPELGGSRAHLDVVGINYYWNCQWEHGADGTWLDDDDPRRLPLRDLVMDVWKRYGGEVVISETAHWGDHRARWLRELADEVEAVLDAGVPLRGVCLYPIIGMRDWHHPRDWMPMGLWDIDCSNGMCRIVHAPTLDAFLETQEKIEAHPACAQSGDTPIA
jgi:beta-glucosidase/6-phospho-beta-glucosidase/beta-galactosidase